VVFAVMTTFVRSLRSNCSDNYSFDSPATRHIHKSNFKMSATATAFQGYHIMQLHNAGSLRRKTEQGGRFNNPTVILTTHSCASCCRCCNLQAGVPCCTDRQWLQIGTLARHGAQTCSRKYLSAARGNPRTLLPNQPLLAGACKIRI
jgi:hypothetical protein